MTKQKNYKKTLIACYLGFVTQAISANFTPLLFLTFKNTYGIGFEKIALIPMVFSTPLKEYGGDEDDCL